MSAPERDAPSSSGFGDAQIPLGGGLWRSLGQNGALVAGYALVAIHVVVVTVAAFILGGDVRLSSASARPVVMSVQVSTVLLPLLAMCFLIIGELIRRGRWGGPSGHKPEALLPQGTNTVDLRLIPLRWNVVWVVLTGVLAALLLWLSVKDMTEYYFGGDLETMLIVNGIMLAGAFGTAVGALVKKVSWLRRRRRAPRSELPVHPALARRRGTSLGVRFWRSFSFRWRFDIWLCALGALALWLAALAFLTKDQISGSEEAAWIFGSVGAVFVITGLWATTQFWRSGEDLANAESVA